MARVQDVTFYTLTPPGSGSVESMYRNRMLSRIVRDNLELTIFWQMTGPTKATTSDIRSVMEGRPSNDLVT